jgi:thiol-disulfide isomerase/thioredoxin
MPPICLRVSVRWRGVGSRLCGLVAFALAAAGCTESASPEFISAQVAQFDSQAEGTTDVAEKFEQPVATSREPRSAVSEVQQDDNAPADPFPRKIPLPKDALEGGIEWLNTSGPITLPALRGKVVLLDFWTYCCINCMHVLPDLKKLEEKYANQLVVIGVHSAKFETERESQNIREAILRYEIKHPVVNDADMIIWRHFDVQAWPTMWLIDPESNAVGRISAEGVFEALDGAIDRLVKFHRAKGTLRESPVHFDLEQSRATDTPLRFPGKIVADAGSGRLFIADSNHNRIVIASLAGKLLDVVGTGEAGMADGTYDRAAFFRPQGLALDGDVLYVADTENHSVRRIDLKAREVSTVAGIGTQGRSRSFDAQPAKETALNSPWDLWLHEGVLYIAMAGPHQIWVWNPKSGEVAAFAGSGHEDIEDGPLPLASFAQPSGLASDGDWLFVADSEGSSIRAVPLIPEKTVWTVVGTAELQAGRLFEFGDADGGNGQARLQHPLGVAWHKSALYVADTYNNKIKVIDVEKRECITLVGTADPGSSDDPPEFDEPGGLSAAGDNLYVADSNNHAIRVIDLKTKAVRTLQIQGLEPPRTPTRRPSPGFPNAERITLDRQTLPPDSQVEFRIQVDLPEGFKINELAPFLYQVDNGGSAEIVRGDSIGKLQRASLDADRCVVTVSTVPGVGSGTIRLSLSYYICREGAEGICQIRSAVYEIPVERSAKATQKHIDIAVQPAENR